MSDELQLKFTPSGKSGRGTMTVYLRDSVVFIDTLNLSEFKSRDRFITELQAACPGVSPDIVKAELMKQGAELLSQGSNRPNEVAASAIGEVDVTNVVCPERFILPEVSGISVPILSDLGGSVTGRWRIYLQWSDGRREVRDLGPYLDVPSGRVWMSPDPAPPSAATAQNLGGWSAASRRDWLAGVEVPDPATVYQRLVESFMHFIDLPPEYAAGTCATIVLWTMLTYVYPAWPAVPYLHVTGPTGSGKSRLFDFLARTTFRPLSSSNLTGPALFRTLNDRGGCVLFDEAERLKQTHSPDVGELNSMLLAGYRRGGQATRLEAVGDKFQTVSFDVFGPKALACIAGLPTALATRCIPVAMFRAPPGSEKPRRRIDADPKLWQGLRDDLHWVALAHGPTWRELAEQAEVCPAMSGRDFELWQPLLALASWIESYGVDGLHEVVLQHAQQMNSEYQDDHIAEADEVLLLILAEAYREARWVTPGEVLDEAKKRDLQTFVNWHPKAVALRFKSYGIPQPKKVGSRREYRALNDAMFQRIQKSYGIALGLSLPDVRVT